MNYHETEQSLFAASYNETTGLIPSPALNSYEASNYEELYPYLPPVPPNTKITEPDTPMAEGIHAEYRTHVSPQTHKKH